MWFKDLRISVNRPRIILIIYSLCSAAIAHAQSFEVVHLQGSRFACGRNDQGKNSLLRAAHSGFEVRSFRKSTIDRTKKLTELNKNLQKQRKLLENGGVQSQDIRLHIKDFRARRVVLKAEISFIKKCKGNRIPFPPKPTPTPSQTSTPSPTASPSPTPNTEDAFLNFESMQVHPMVLSADRTAIFAVNTADSRLEIFRVVNGAPIYQESVFTGYDPVSVRLQNDTTAWVVNRISRTVSIIDLSARKVVRTLRTGDLPTDVAFASGKAFVTNSTENQIQVFNLNDLSTPPQTIAIRGLRPFALDVTPSGKIVGLSQISTDTALVSRMIVNLSISPYQGQNPVPNNGQGFFPPINPALPPPPETSLIVKRGADGRMYDASGADWTGGSLILPEDNDVFEIDPATFAIQYHQLDFSNASALAVKPNGTLSVVGTRATNVMRFEPNLRGNFARVEHATLNLSTGAKAQVNLNPHLTFSAAQIDAQGDSANFSEALRNRSLGNPSAVVWRNDGTRGYVVGQGSQTLIQIDASGNRIEALPSLFVGAGPSGLVIDQIGERLYSYNGHAASISVVDLGLWQVVGEVSFNDPTPEVVRRGRPFLYDTHKTSGMGTFSCATCHINGDTDFLNWDLGNPAGEMKTITQNCLVPPEQGGCVNHPMKGPFTTQTLQEIIGNGPLHWRGDKNNLSEFNGAFSGLLGSPRELTDTEMNTFEEYVKTISIPPSPYRAVDNTLKTNLSGANAVRGQQIFMAACDICHRAAGGGKGGIVPNMTSPEPSGESQLFIDGVGIIPRLDVVRHKLPVQSIAESSNGRSIVPVGFLHDGSTTAGGLFGGFVRGAIGIGAGLTPEQVQGSPEIDQAISDMIGFIRSFPVRTHAGIGTSMTVTLPNITQQELQLIGEMLVATESGEVAIIAKLKRDATTREEGFIVKNDQFIADRAGVSYSYTAFFAQYNGANVTLMLVPAKAAHRMGIDRDNDGILDGDEVR